MKTNLHPYTERMLREVCESVQQKIHSLTVAADRETCPGARQSLKDEIAALYEDKQELKLLLT